MKATLRVTVNEGEPILHVTWVDGHATFVVQEERLMPSVRRWETVGLQEWVNTDTIPEWRVTTTSHEAFMPRLAAYLRQQGAFDTSLTPFRVFDPVKRRLTAIDRYALSIGLREAPDTIKSPVPSWVGRSTRAVERRRETTLLLDAPWDATQLSRWLGCEVSEIQQALAGPQPPYQLCKIPKRTGGWRELQVPDEPLKRLQRRLLDHLSARVQVHPAAHGFVRGRSILSNAALHQGSRELLTIDIRDFFPSTTALHVAEALRRRAPWIPDTTRNAILRLTTMGRRPLEATPLTNTLHLDRLLAEKLEPLEKPEWLNPRRYGLQGLHRRDLTPGETSFFARNFEFQVPTVLAEAAGRLLGVFRQKPFSHLSTAVIRWTAKHRRDTGSLGAPTPKTLKEVLNPCLSSFGVVPPSPVTSTSLEAIAQQLGVSWTPPLPPRAEHVPVDAAEQREPWSFWWEPQDTHNGTPETERIPFGTPALPQGAPTSPFLANLVFYDLDEAFQHLAMKSNLRYSRYADDLAFSGEMVPTGFVGAVARILERKGYWIAREKVSHRFPHQRQLVTGIVVNEGLRPPREEVRRMRAILHQIDKLGEVRFFKQQRDRAYGLTRGAVRGTCAWIRMVSPEAWTKLSASSRWLTQEE